MDHLNHFNQEFQLQTLLAEAKVILNRKGDINEEKENLSQIIERVDFLLGKHDEIYNQFTEIFTAMGQFDFSKRLPFNENGDQIINFIVSGLNMLSEEFQASAINKKLFHNFFTSLALKDTLVVVTNAEGFICFANSGNTSLADFDDKSLVDQSIHVLFADFSIIENCIKDEGSIKNIEAEMKWKGNKIPVKVDVRICNTHGKIESLIYVIKLN